RVAVERGTRFNVLADFGLQCFLATIWNDGSADVSTTLQNTDHRSLVFTAKPVIRRCRLSMCMFRALPPMKVSSTSTSPDSLEKEPERIARRTRCIICHADF